MIWNEIDIFFLNSEVKKMTRFTYVTSYFKRCHQILFYAMQNSFFKQGNQKSIDEDDTFLSIWTINLYVIVFSRVR